MGMNNVERSEQATQPRRRRRRSRSRGQGRSSASTGQSQPQATGQGKSQSKTAQAKSAQGKTAAGKSQAKSQERSRKGGQAKSSQGKSKNHSKAASRSALKHSRSGKRRGPSHKRPSRKSSGQRSFGQVPRHTSIETSAGGLVASGLAEAVREDNSVDLSKIYVALIGRLDRRNRLLWSMPKGHVEPGEAHDSTAEREVWEETGIHGQVLVELGVIDYWFVSEGKRIHKTVHHHLLRYVDGDLNDEDPEVTEVTWVPADTLVERLAYADERKLARRAHDLLPEIARAEKQAGRATPR